LANHLWYQSIAASYGCDVITYNLSCSAGHEFEGWFKDSTAYETQAKARALVCPVCGDHAVEKAIMAPALGSATREKGRAEKQQLRQYASGLRKFIEKNADYVGPKFPEEARKIHYGEAEERHIYGESTLKEAKELIEEGVEIAPIPPDPDDLN
jgi:hypothetical protein